MTLFLSSCESSMCNTCVAHVEIPKWSWWPCEDCCWVCVCVCKICPSFYSFMFLQSTLAEWAPAIHSHWHDSVAQQATLKWLYLTASGRTVLSNIFDYMRWRKANTLLLIWTLCTWLRDVEYTKLDKRIEKKSLKSINLICTNVCLPFCIQYLKNSEGNSTPVIYFHYFNNACFFNVRVNFFVKWDHQGWISLKHNNQINARWIKA